jgi:hypothetical protein
VPKLMARLDIQLFVRDPVIAFSLKLVSVL